MAPDRYFYTMETSAHRDGYGKEDVEGETLEKNSFWEDAYDAPETLQPTFNIEDVWRRWKSGLINEDLRTSNDAGHYLCDFTYYACMLEFWRQDPKGHRPCMFLHVPGEWGAEDIQKGREVALGLIDSLVESKMRGVTSGQQKSRDGSKQT